MAPGKPEGNLDDEFQGFLKDRETVRCYTCKLPADLREWVESQMRAEVSTIALAEFLKLKGHKMGHAALLNHHRNHVPR